LVKSKYKQLLIILGCSIIIALIGSIIAGVFVFILLVFAYLNLKPNYLIYIALCFLFVSVILIFINETKAEQTALFAYYFLLLSLLTELFCILKNRYDNKLQMVKKLFSQVKKES